MLRVFRVFVFSWLASSTAAAQTAPVTEQPPLGSVLTGELLRDLPLASNPLTALETLQPEAIADRFLAGGLNVAVSPRVGGFLNSWTQTQYRIGDVTMTDPRAGGTPLLLPIAPWWDRMTIAAGGMAFDDNASALSATLQPRRPAATWLRFVEGSLSGPGLAANPAGPVPAVDRVGNWQDGNALLSGPLSDRLGLVAAASWRRLSHVAAPATSTTADRVASGFAHLVFTASPRDEVRALGWVQQAATDAFSDAAVHVQSTWERRAAGQMAWRVFGGYTERNRSTPPITPTLVVDSFTSDPVSNLLDPPAGTSRRWVVGARAARPGKRWFPAAGVDLEGVRVGVEPTALQQIRELVDGVPARLWTVHGGTDSDERHLTTFAAYANEQVTLPYRLTLDAGLRLDRVSAAADRSANDIGWTTWLPRVTLRWQAVDKGRLALVASYRRSAYQLPLDVLAIGDQAAPVADVSLLRGSSIGPLIARVGPGTAGDAAFTRIDPQLRRPTTDELILAVEGRPVRWLHVQLARVTKREEPLLGFFNTGLDPSAYTTLQVPDPSFVPENVFGRPQVTVFNRPPASYGRDRYLLTNRIDDFARFWGLQLTVRVDAERFTVLAGGSLTEAIGPAAAVGFLPTENDQDIVGSLFVDPNAGTHARGQLFQDRSHVVKLAASYRFPLRITLGAIARYQDGQPFGRIVIVPNLTQGATAVRSYANGGSAFTYTGTLDVRVQKILTTRRSEVAAIAEIYNLPNLGNEVSEYVGSGPMFRTPTALQPPRTSLLGVRMTF